MENLAERIVALRKKRLKLTQEQFAKRLGVTRGYLSRIEANLQTPGPDFLANLEAIERTEFAISTENKVAESRREKSNVYGGPRHLRSVRIYSRVQAGRATMWEELPEEWQEEMGYAGNDPNAFGLEIWGDSMRPDFNQGDIAICTPSIAATSGDLVVANLKERGCLFKLMHASGNHSKITLASFNPLYPPQEYRREDLHWMYPVEYVIKKTRFR